VDDASELSELLNGLRAGDPRAYDRLYQRYGAVIRAAVRRRLAPRLRCRFDSMDFVHDVWASIFAIPKEQLQFDSPEAMRGFLQKIAYNKVIEVFRQQFDTQKRDVTREVRLEPLELDRQTALPSPTATPSQWAIAGEEFERLLSQFPHGHRVIIERLRDGYSIEDIARLTKVSTSTVSRVVRRLKDITGV
jgi:RNA polymerase sigma-70 factor (ECF subfamily)